MQCSKSQLLVAVNQSNGIGCPFCLGGAEGGKRCAFWDWDGFSSTKAKKPFTDCLRHDRQGGERATDILHAMRQQSLNHRRQSRRHVCADQTWVGVDGYVEIARQTRILDRYQPRCGKTVGQIDMFHRPLLKREV